MQPDTFIKFLKERNRSFIGQISSESILWMMDNKKKKGSKQRQCIFISFDPPLNSPPFIFEWEGSEVCYFNQPTLEAEFYKIVETACEEVELPYIVFVEKKNPPHKRKILRWIRGFKETVYRNRPQSEHVNFLLAEYKAPLFQVEITELGKE